MTTHNLKNQNKKLLQSYANSNAPESIENMYTVTEVEQTIYLLRDVKYYNKLIVTQLIKKYPAFFTEPKVSSLCSQKPTTGPYPEPAESSSPHQSLISLRSSFEIFCNKLIFTVRGS
jgi:hypothetical protein